MKQFGTDKQQRTKPDAVINRQKPGHPPLLAQHGLFGAKLQTIDFTSAKSQETVSKSNIFDRHDSSSFIGLEYQSLESIDNSELSSNIHQTQVKPNQSGCYE